MKPFKRILSAILMALTLMPVFTSCVTKLPAEKLPESEGEIVTVAEMETEPETQKETEAMTETEPATETEKATETEPETEKATETETEKATETETEKATEPETEKATEPETEKATETEPEAVPAEADWTKYGLQVGEGGTILLNGKPFYGMGVNYFGIVDIYETRGIRYIERYFKKLAEGDIPFIRMKFGAFYGNEAAAFLNETKMQAYLKKMDAVVQLAEKYEIGIVASLVWNKNIFPDYFGETLDVLTDPTSKSIQAEIDYIQTVVSRYKHSPAIWAWEIGNEGDLACNLYKYKNKDGKEVLYTTEDLTKYYEIIGKVIGEEDPYRMVTGGDSVRNTSVALEKSQGNSWTPNTFEDWKTTFEWYTPAPMNTISLHYPSSLTLSHLVKAAKELGIGLFVGEFYSEALYENYEDKKSPEEDPKEKMERDSFAKVLERLQKADVQLACYWCFGRYCEMADNCSIELGIHAGIYQNVYAFDGLSEVNRTYQAEGKTDAEAYWATMTPQFYKKK